jgi:PilZ domain
MSNERRRNFRVEWNSPATIHDLERDLVRPCILSNFSNTGARITGVRADTIPDEFVLRITGGRGRTRKCRVLWRSGDTLGVEFIDCKTIDANVNHAARERA